MKPNLYVILDLEQLGALDNTPDDDVITLPELREAAQSHFRCCHVPSELPLAEQKKLCQEVSSYWSSSAPDDPQYHDILLNGIYSSFFEILAGLLSKIDVLRSQYNKVILLGGSSDVNFVAANLTGLGEQPWKFLYRVAWGFNPFIARTFPNNVLWRQDRASSLQLKKVVRELGMWAGTSYRMLRLHLSKFGHTSHSAEGADFVIPVRSLHQWRIAQAIKEASVGQGVRVELVLYCMLNDQSMLQAIQGTDTDTLFRPSGVATVVGSSMSALWGLMKMWGARGGDAITLHAKDHQLQSRQTFAESYCTPYFQLYQRLLAAHLSRVKPKMLISLEMVDKHGFSEVRCARVENIPVVNVQTALCRAKYYPRAVVGDMFLVSTKSEEAAFHALGEQNVHFFGPVKYLGIEPCKEHAGPLKRVLFATQPIERDLQHELINSLLGWCNENDVALTIKLHPRENFADFTQYSQVANVVGREHIDNAGLMKSHDVVISRTSSILEEAFYLNVPAIMVRMSEGDNAIRYEVFVDEVFDCSGVLGVKEKLVGFSRYRADFYRERHDYLRARDIVLGEALANMFFVALRKVAK